MKPRVEVGNLDIVRDFTDVRDVVAGYRLLAARGAAGEIYNLGTGRGVKLADALDILRASATARSRSTSTPPASGPSTSRSWSPTRRSCAPRRGGSRGSRSRGRWRTCSTAGGRRWGGMLGRGERFSPAGRRDTMGPGWPASDRRGGRWVI